MINEIFLSVCMLTTLNCNEIDVSFKDLPSKYQAQSYLMNTGRIGIWVNHIHEHESAYFFKDLFVHEVSHLIRFTEKPTGAHDKRFKEICKRVAKAADVHQSACNKHG